jgi:hypothetical protein
MSIRGTAIWTGLQTLDFQQATALRSCVLRQPDWFLCSGYLQYRLGNIGTTKNKRSQDLIKPSKFEAQCVSYT